MRILILTCAAMAMGGTAGAQCDPYAVTCGSVVSMPATNGGNHSWHYVSQTYGGHISAMGGLSKEECDAMVKRTRGEPSTEEEIRGAAYLQKKREARLDRCRAIDAPATTVETLACISAGSYVHTSDDVSDAECYQ